MTPDRPTSFAPEVEAVIGTEASLLELLYRGLDDALKTKINEIKSDLSRQVRDRDAAMKATLRVWESRAEGAEAQRADLQRERDRADERAARVEIDRQRLEEKLDAASQLSQTLEDQLRTERVARTEAEAALDSERARAVIPAAPTVRNRDSVPEGCFGAQLQGWSLSELDGETILGWGRPDPSPDYSTNAYGVGGWSFYHALTGPPKGVSARRFRPELTLVEADRWVEWMTSEIEAVAWLPGVEDHDPACVASTPWGALYADATTAEKAGVRLGSGAFPFSSPISLTQAVQGPPPLGEWLAAGLAMEKWLVFSGFTLIDHRPNSSLWVVDRTAPDQPGAWTPRMEELHRLLLKEGLPVQRTAADGQGHRKYGHGLYFKP